MQRGLQLHRAGELAGAEASYEKALARDAMQADALQLFGLLAHQTGRQSLALELMCRAVAARPRDPGLRVNLGNLYKESGRYADALTEYRKSCEIAPGDPDVHFNIGLACHLNGDLEGARGALEESLRLRPGDVEGLSNYGNVLRDLGRHDEAKAAFERAIALAPSLAVAHNNLGTVLQKLKQPDSALACYRKALEIDNGYDAALENLMGLSVELKGAGRILEAMDVLRWSMARRPDCAEAHHNLANCLDQLGQTDKAIQAYRQALVLKPDYGDAASNLCFVLGWNGLGSPSEYLDAARGWEKACVPASEREAAKARLFPVQRPHGRRLRVGFVSGDFRRHAVSYFVDGLFGCFDRDRVEIFAYSICAHEDDVTQRIRARVDQWLQVTDMDDRSLRDRIESDGIDVLVDLAGHTNFNRLGVFARRAAPVQAHYLGYFASTGISEIDYWIGDDVVSPAEHAPYFSEQVWRLPRGFMAYAGREDAPAPEREAGQEGLVLGSFNNLTKMTPATYALWARVLAALPGSRLYLKTKELADEATRRHLLDRFGELGVGPHRLELSEGNVKGDWNEHMAHYGRVDIALDPVGGMSGSTTTCDALWMGVPVVTLLGDRMASRVSASMLTSLGRAEWIARDADDYVAKVLGLAANAEQRAGIRSQLRNEMRRSALCDAAGLAASLEEAFLAMYRNYESRRLQGAVAS